MGGQRGKKNPRRTSTEDERTLSLIITMMRGHKKRMLNAASASAWNRVGMKKYLVICLLFRWMSAYVIQTEFVPDEAWQSSEVAYVYTWGRGHLTWEWLVGLRNHLYPFVIAVLYRCLKWMGSDSPYSLVILPRLVMGTLTGFGDWAFFLYCASRYGLGSAKWSLTLFLTCWFTFYCGSRTLTNTAEMSLNCIAMYLLQMDQVVLMVGVVALNFLIRPTALVIWIPQMFDIWKLFFPRRVPYRLPASIFVGLSIIVLGAVLDSMVYGKPTLTWLRFIQFNFIQGDSAQFGEHHVLWYFYSAVPSILGFCVIPLLFSLWLRLHQKEWISILAFIFCFSLIRHKEIRFLLPIIPHLFAIVGDVIYKCGEFGKDPEVMKREKVDIGRILNHFIILVIASNIVAAMYFTSFHQGSILPITNYVNTHSASIPQPHIWVMMQCYSVPVFTYMHNPSATFEYMSCGPTTLDPGIASQLHNYHAYSTNATILEQFISAKLSSPGGQPPHFILSFESLSATLIQLMAKVNGGGVYEVCFSNPHAQFGDNRGMAHVLCAKDAFGSGDGSGGASFM